MEGGTKNFYHEASYIDENGSRKTLKIPVVQELARIGVENLPKIFTQPSSNIIAPSISCSPEDFPCVSLAKLRSRNAKEREDELRKLVVGGTEWGMVLLSNHGIPFSLLNNVKDVVKGFFGLSFEEKKKSVGSYASADNMGYGRNFVKSKDQMIEWIDRMTMMVAPKGSTDGLNVWPQNPSNFREVIENYAEEARKVGNEMLQTLAEALSLDKNTFLKYFDQKTSEIKVRVNYYPPCPKPELTLGINPHSDPSALSLLIQFEASGGLQVMHKDQKHWVSIPWPDDALLVLFGDLLEIMSNGRLNSCWHRAVTQAHVERYSIALFYNPQQSTEIEPVKADDEAEDKYKKVVVSEYLQHYYKICPTATKEAINYAKV